jgi:hypothetical protein
LSLLFDSLLIFYGRVLCHISLSWISVFLLLSLFFVYQLLVGIAVKEGVLCLAGMVSSCVTYNLYIPYAFIFCVSHHIIPLFVKEVYAISRFYTHPELHFWHFIKFISFDSSIFNIALTLYNACGMKWAQNITSTPI